MQSMESKPPANKTVPPQKVLVFQQNGSGESKIAGVRKYGGSRIVLEVISINDTLPPLVEDTSAYLPREVKADLVLDFLKHPDLSHDLADICGTQAIPLIASGKTINIKGVHTPST